jgi:hypothetical protein
LCIPTGHLEGRETKEKDAMDERNPKSGPTPSQDVPVQRYPGVEGKMEPAADHGETSYTGSGKLRDLVGIRVNCVAPGPVWRPLIPSTFEHEKVVEFGKDTVWKRPAQPAEIAPAYVFLASADAPYITGEIIAITGRSGTR